MAQKWTNADLGKVSRFGRPDLSTFEPEQLNLDGFEPLENVDMRAPKTTPYTGDPNRMPVEAPKDRSYGEDIWNELNRPHVNVHQYTDKAADYIDNPTLKPDWMPDSLYKGIAMLKGAHAGAVQGLGNLAEGFTSDLGLLTALPTDGLAGVAPSAARALSLANKGAGAAFAVSGAQKVLDSKKPWSERVTGIPEMAGGAAAFLHTPAAKATEPTLTAGERLGKEFNSKIPPPKPPSGPPPIDFEALRQPNLQAVDNGPLQLDLLNEHNPFTSSAKQRPLVEEPRPEPFVDTAEQGKLDLTPSPVRMPNEFLPDGSFESKLTPERQGAPRSLFEKPTPKLEPEKVPFQRVPDDILDEMIASKPDYSNPRLERVPIDSLRATQDTLNPDAVNDYIKQGDRPELTEVPSKAKGRMDDEAPVVIRVGDENILAGGHHRATADLANGKGDIQAIVYDAPNVSPELIDRLKASIQKDFDEGTKRPFNPEDDVPLFSRSEKGGVKIDVNTRNAARELTTGYTRELPAIMIREALQNAKDAIHHLGNEGRIRTKIDKEGFTITDNGKGMSRQELETVFSNLHESGKTADKNATGGKGIGKATYMLGGEHFEVITVKEVNGKKIESRMAGTPDEFHEHVDVYEREVPPDTPTFTKITTKFSPEQRENDAYWQAQKMYREIHDYSRNLPGHLTDAEDASYRGTGNKFNPFKQTKDDQTIATLKIGNHDVGIHVAKDTPIGEENILFIDVLNNGMYQYSDHIYLGDKKIPGIPERVIADIAPKAEEGTVDYPFPTQRENLKADIDKELKDSIRHYVVDPQKTKFANTTQKLYDSMAGKDLGGARKSLIFDPGNRLTSRELELLNNNPVIQKVNKLLDRVTDEALRATGNTEWIDRLEGVGMMFSEPGFYGVHVPNPTTGKSSIMVNFLNHLDEASHPADAAWDTISTLFHEHGHIGKKTPVKKLQFNPDEMDDPRIGRYMQMYLENVKHGGETTNLGHGADWLARTAEIMTKFGPKKAIEAVDELTKIFEHPKFPDRYNGQVEELLRLAEERRRRPETTPDYLSPTGIKSESPTGGKGDITGGNEADIFGTTPTGTVRPTSPTGENLTTAFNQPIKWSEKVKPQPAESIQTTVKKIQQKGPKAAEQLVKQTGDQLKQVKEAEGVTRDEKENLLEKLLNFQRTVLTSVDLSAPGRQGLPLIGRKEWWTSWKPMFEALGSDKGYETVMDSIKNDPSGLFTPTGKKGSFANEAGLSLTDKLDHREELFRSKWAEEFPGTKFFVKPSVRAYTGYLNKLRADTFKNMVKAAGAENNLPAAKAIADYINVATGRGSLGAFESAAKPLAQVFFSPRLAASRMQMYTRTFNPWYYASVPKEVRVNQLKSMLALAGTGLAMGQLAKGIGAHVELDDPYNSDFGKIRFGNTRIDPFAGHQQYLVAAARLLMGKTTSSTTGKTHSLTTGKFGMPNRASVFGNFMKNKLAPVPSFIWSWMEGKSFDGKPFDAKNEAMQRIVPIVTQDLYDIWKEDPTLLQGALASGSAMIGGGVQTYGR